MEALVDGQRQSCRWPVVLDDEDLVRVSTADMLTDSGFIVVVVTSGAEALKILDQEFHFDYLVTDFMMLKMNGSRSQARFAKDTPCLHYCLFLDLRGQCNLVRSIRAEKTVPPCRARSQHGRTLTEMTVGHGRSVSCERSFMAASGILHAIWTVVREGAYLIRRAVRPDLATCFS